ncbi:DsbA family protein [Phaeovulum sp.]|uniref:DsbA family protein n=1 Tax=Phaeovulum sp. TaxID=2934796 RepID=UPI003565EB7B
MAKTTPMMLLGLVAAAAVAAGGWWLVRPKTSVADFTLAAIAQEASTETAELLPDMVIGNEDAKVTVIEYASFTCPHCGDFHANVFAPLQSEYIDTGLVQFIHREVYFDKFGLMAAMIANCGGPEKYFPVMGVIYDTQVEWYGDGAESTIINNLIKIGLKSGLSQEAVNACISDNARAEAMVANYLARAGADDVNATPTLFVNGVKYSNMAYADLKKIIDAELAK